MYGSYQTTLGPMWTLVMGLLNDIKSSGLSSLAKLSKSNIIQNRFSPTFLTC